MLSRYLPHKLLAPRGRKKTSITASLVSVYHWFCFHHPPEGPKVVSYILTSLPSFPRSACVLYGLFCRMGRSICFCELDRAAFRPLAKGVLGMRWPRSQSPQRGHYSGFCQLGQQRSCHVPPCVSIPFSLLREGRHPNNPFFGDLFHCNAPRAGRLHLGVCVLYNGPFRESCDRQIERGDQYLHTDASKTPSVLECYYVILFVLWTPTANGLFMDS